MLEDFFDHLILFRDLSPQQRDLLRPLFAPCDYLAGDILFEQGDPAEYLYVLLHGEVIIRFKPDDGPALIVARILPEGVVGWSSALGSPTYTSGAMCVTDCQMARVRGQDLCKVIESDPETGTLVLERLAAVIAERFRNTHGQVINLLEQGLRIERS
jgi:CRP-like cAMP-binding protein